MAKKKSKNPHLIKILLSGTIFLIIIGGAVLIYPSLYRNKIYPGIKVGNINLGGKTYLEALDLIEVPITSFNEEGLIFIFGEERIILQPTVVGTDIDSSYDILTFNSNISIREAYMFGRRSNFWDNFRERFAALFFGQSIVLEHFFNKAEIEKSLKQNFAQFETPHTDASLKVNQELSFIIEEEKEGEIFNYQLIVDDVENNVKNLDFKPVYLELVVDLPAITKAQVEGLIPQAEEYLDLPPLTINYGDKSWVIDKKTFSNWLDFRISSDSFNQNKIGVGLSPKKAGEYLESIRDEIDVEVKEGKFKIEDGVVSQFQNSQLGISLAVIPSVLKMENDFIDNNKKKSELVVEEEQPKITTENVNNLGIKELIGVGVSDFSGSPRNRRANIQLGADKLNGILIKPDQEFSLLKALGKFEASEGWLPELVIKGNRTVPELGGGACQFGTTMFRAALDTGLPIIARQNHSYTVSYYYPIGTDATIYDPAPDLKFINDTGNYILLQTRIEGNELIFEMWGTKDGRTIEKTEPRLYGWQSPPPKKTVETEDLAPGEVKCTERAHQGVSAEFDYRVTYPNGELKEETFQSKYKPWQEVCLVGIEKKSEEPEEENKKENKETTT